MSLKSNLVDHHCHFSGSIPGWFLPFAKPPKHLSYADFFAEYQRRKAVFAELVPELQDRYIVGAAAIAVESALVGVDEIFLIAGVDEAGGTSERVAHMEEGRSLASAVLGSHGLTTPLVNYRLTFIRSGVGFTNCSDIPGCFKGLDAWMSFAHSLDISGVEPDSVSRGERNLLEAIQAHNSARIGQTQQPILVSCHAGERLDHDPTRVFQRIHELLELGVRHFAHLNCLWVDPFVQSLDRSERDRHKKLVELLRSTNCAIDICPTSTRLLCQLDHVSFELSLKRLKSLDLHLQIGTDNPSILGTDIRTEKSMLGNPCFAPRASQAERVLASFREAVALKP